MGQLVGVFTVHKIVSSGSLAGGHSGPIVVLIDPTGYCSAHYSLGMEVSRVAFLDGGH